MSISSILNTGVKGMVATQLATQVSANNIANSATVGYTRRGANILPEDALTGGNGARRAVEPFIEKRLLGARSGSGEASTERVALEVLDNVFAEGDGSVGAALDAFQVSIQDLSARPQDAATRQQVLSTANQLSTAFANAAAQLETARSDANARVSEGVQQVNQRLSQISALGTEIQQAEVNGQEASELRDQRDLLIREVAERVPVSVLDQGNGQLSLMLAGAHQLVSPDGKVNELSTTTDADGALRIEKVASGARVDVTALVSSGSVGGALKARSGALNEALQRLDQLAADVANGYNAAHRQGFGTDGESGRNLFEPPSGVAGAAKALSVSADVLGAPERIAAASESTNLPADNRGALALSALSSAPLALGGTTVSEALASLIGFAGSAVQNASQAESFSSGALAQVEALREASSGVSSDEEMVALMKYQRAYEASLKVIQVADQMLSDLLQIRG